MEAADDRNACIPQCPGQIIGAKDQIPWAFDRTEKTKERPLEDRYLSKSPYFGEKVAVLFVPEVRGVFSAFGGYACDI
jgi:hypothetical protein